ncbi:protein of unknown function [Legionella hackeliae]|uniref:Uncharacterized protein n=1 Tax=Legionella hackeliae TaxID=449 RepID=A0A0A8UZK7_LEGHA|nr:protein of unknown function [Legionella hackeliae]
MCHYINSEATVVASLFILLSIQKILIPSLTIFTLFHRF